MYIFYRINYDFLRHSLSWPCQLVLLFHYLCKEVERGGLNSWKSGLSSTVRWSPRWQITGPSDVNHGSLPRIHRAVEPRRCWWPGLSDLRYAFATTYNERGESKVEKIRFLDTPAESDFLNYRPLVCDFERGNLHIRSPGSLALKGILLRDYNISRSIYIVVHILSSPSSLGVHCHSLVTPIHSHLPYRVLLAQILAINSPHVYLNSSH